MTKPGKSIVKIREEASRRLEELEPLVEEAERLRSVLTVLDAEARLAGAGSDPGRPSALSADAGSAPEKSAYVRADKEAILAVIAENPGITAAEIARRKGMKRTVVATTIARMKRQGQLVPDGPGARLPG